MSAATLILTAMQHAELTSAPPSSSLSSEVELWLASLNDVENLASVYWAAYGAVAPDDWVATRSIEQLAVLVSGCTKANNNVCQVHGARDTSARSTSVIGLHPNRGPQGGFAVNLYQSKRRAVGDVRRSGYRLDNYEGFSAIKAAEISWAWVSAGVIPRGLTYRTR